MIEVAFIIEKPDQEKCAFLIRIVEIEKQELKVKFFPSNRIFYMETLKKLATGKDKEAIIALINEEMQFQSLSGLRHHSETLPFNKIHVQPGHVEKILKALSPTGKVFFNQKQILVDFLTPVEFFCMASVSPQNGCLITGMCRWNKEEKELHKSDLLFQGPPHGILKDRVLRFLSGKQRQEIDWKWIKPFQTQASISFESSQTKEILEKYQDQDFEFLFDPKLVEVEKDPDIFPILVLSDRSGGFANLYMDYGQGNVVGYNESGGKKRLKEIEKRWEQDLLETDFIKKQVGSTFYYCPLNEVAKSLTFLLECGWTIKDAQGRKVYRLSESSITIQDKENALLIQGKAKYENHEIDLKNVVGAFNRRETFISLSPDSIGLLSDSIKEGELSAILEGELVEEGIKIKKNAFGSLKELFSNPKIHLDSSVDALKNCIEHFEGIVELKPNPDFLAVLRPYQQLGVNWLGFLYNFNFHGLLADDMGLGKTVQILAFLSTINSKKPHLIVLPTTLLFNWQREIERFLPHWKIYKHHGQDRSKNREELKEYPIILTSYGILRQDRDLLGQLEFECVIIDEAQAIKNPDSQVARAVCAMQAKFRLSVTGTPVENRLEDLWSQFNFLMPDLLGSKEEFSAQIQASLQDTRYMQRIRKKITPFILRRTKSQVAQDLPEKIEQIVWVEMDSDQRKFYENFLAGARQGLLQKVNLEGIKSHRMEVFETILRLRQICCHPQLVSSIIEEITPSSKLEQLMQDLETLVAEGKKVLIYSQFTSMLTLIAKEVEKRCIAYAYLDGATQNRQRVVEQFQMDPKTPLFLISLKAGGIGLNLTAADYVLLFDPWWNDAVENQAIDRAHRIGRKDTVIAKRYIIVESIEEKMMKLKAAKRSIAQEILMEGEQSLSLTEEDLNFLLS